MPSVPQTPGATGPAIPDGPPARLRLFGFTPTEVGVELARRDRSWRLTRALFAGFVALGLAPLAALVPPHVPWALLVLGGGVVVAGRRLREQSTLLRLEGSCPACGAPQTLATATRLRHPHRFPCPGCHRELTLEIRGTSPRDDLAAGGGPPADASTPDPGEPSP